MRITRSCLISICFVMELQGQPAAQKTGVDIIGKHYSTRLRDLIIRAEKTKKKPIEFTRNLSNEDNTYQDVGSKVVIALHPGSPEDNIAHELMHSILEAEGYPRAFFIKGRFVSRTIHALIVGDFDHLLINDRLLKEGYDAANGFLEPIRDQYRSIMSLQLPLNADSDQRAMYIILLIHELMKQVYYVENPGAEAAILSAHPAVKPYWLTLKPQIEAYRKKPSPHQGWSFVSFYTDCMDRITSDMHASFRFSEEIGFSPARCRLQDLSKPASFSIRTDQKAGSTLTRLYMGRVMVGVVLMPVPGFDLSLRLKDFATKRSLQILADR